MRAQFDNRVMSSFLLWFDHTLIKDGEAWINNSSWFYPVDNLYNSYYTYGAPFKQFVSDFGVTGNNTLATSHPQIPTGVYLDGVHLTTGVSGFQGLNYEQGQVYFSSELTDAETRLSGDYAIKDFNVYLTNEPEEKLLFETKFNIRPKTTETETGLAPNSITYPVVFLRYNGSTNSEIAFGGFDNTVINIRAIVLADSQFNLDAVCSIFRDRVRTFVTLLNTGDMPYNTFGDYKSGVAYNYTGLTQTFESDNYFHIDNVGVSKFTRDVNLRINNLNPDVFNGVIDFEISKARYPRRARLNNDLQ